MTVDIVESPDDAHEGPIVWNYRQDKKIDNQYKTCRFTVRGFEDWTPQWVQAFIDLVQEFATERYQGRRNSKAKKNTLEDRRMSSRSGLLCFVFVVHEDDEQQICNMPTDSRWLFDVEG
jgi:hypothetical protein